MSQQPIATRGPAGPVAAGDYKIWQVIAAFRITPYHIGNGVFGGILPLVGLWVVARTGNIYAGLYYPITVAAVTFVVGSLLLRETHSTLIWKELETEGGGGVVSDMEGPA